MGRTCTLFVWDDSSGTTGQLVEGPKPFTISSGWNNRELSSSYTDQGDGSNNYSRSYYSNNRISWTPWPFGDIMIRAIVKYFLGVEEGSSILELSGFPFQMEPKPSWSSVTIQFEVPSQSKVDLRIYDMKGIVVEAFTYRRKSRGHPFINLGD